MKHAYVSAVLVLDDKPLLSEIQQLDAHLSHQSRAHEIIIVVRHGMDVSTLSDVQLEGPLTVVTTHSRSHPDSTVVAGLARAVGDFIIEWHGLPGLLDETQVASLLEPTNRGIELIEVTGVGSSRTSRAFYTIVNRLRPTNAPIRKTIARVYSRHAIGEILAATTFEPQIDILVAELPVLRNVIASNLPVTNRMSLVGRINQGVSILSKGTRFGSAIPLGLAAVSAALGVGAAIYALGILLFQGTTPEGWTTLMIVIGLGQGAILSMLGLTWTRIDSLTRGLSRSHDATAGVRVFAPNSDAKKLS